MRQATLRRLPRGKSCPEAGFGRGRFRVCNLCEGVFFPRSHWERYCAECRKNNALLRFGSWLPEREEEELPKVIA